MSIVVDIVCAAQRQVERNSLHYHICLRPSLFSDHNVCCLMHTPKIALPKTNLCPRFTFFAVNNKPSFGQPARGYLYYISPQQPSPTQQHVVLE